MIIFTVNKFTVTPPARTGLNVQSVVQLTDSITRGRKARGDDAKVDWHPSVCSDSPVGVQNVVGLHLGSGPAGDFEISDGSGDEEV